MGDKYITGNPCPICRDPYLVVSYKVIFVLFLKYYIKIRKNIKY